MININKIIKQEPTLTALGIEGKRTFHTDILPDPKEVLVCVDWLKSKNLTPTKSATFSSVSIKQQIKKELNTYVTGGAAIAAIIYLGIPYEKIPDSPYVEVFLPKKEIFGKRIRYDRFGQEIKAA